MALTDYPSRVTYATTDAAFRARVQFCIVKAAIAVAAEDPATANHAARRNHATAILLDPASWTGRYALAVVTNLAITDSSSDSDVEFTTNSLFSAMAGV